MKTIVCLLVLGVVLFSACNEVPVEPKQVVEYVDPFADAYVEVTGTEYVYPDGNSYTKDGIVYYLYATGVFQRGIYHGPPCYYYAQYRTRDGFTCQIGRFEAYEGKSTYASFDMTNSGDIDYLRYNSKIEYVFYPLDK